MTLILESVPKRLLKIEATLAQGSEAEFIRGCASFCEYARSIILTLSRYTERPDISDELQAELTRVVAVGRERLQSANISNLDREDTDGCLSRVEARIHEMDTMWDILQCPEPSMP